MLFICKKLLTPLLLLLLASLSHGQDPNTGNTQLLDELDAARLLLAQTEARVGRFDLTLVEPLRQVADKLTALNQFDEAESLLDRATQITRIHSGLHTPVQIDLTRERINNFSDQGDWNSAREQMDYLFAYYMRVPVALQESLIADLLALANQHMRGVLEDREPEKGRHLSRIYQINRAIIFVAGELYGTDSPELAPYLYRQVQHTYLLQKGHDAGGDRRSNANLYYQLRGRYGSWLRDQFDNFTFLEGRLLLEQIRNLYANADTPNPEAVAMSELYLADWHMLYDIAEEAEARYAEAFAALQAAGVNSQQLDSYFSQPRVLPLYRFHTSIDNALAAAGASAMQTTDATTYDIAFAEWSADYPATYSPWGSVSPPRENSSVAHLTFKLDDENEANFFFPSRYNRTIGSPIEVRSINSPFLPENLSARIEQLRFRPALENGRAVESSGSLQYEIAAAD